MTLFSAAVRFMALVHNQRDIHITAHMYETEVKRSVRDSDALCKRPPTFTNGCASVWQYRSCWSRFYVSGDRCTAHVGARRLRTTGADIVPNPRTDLNSKYLFTVCT